MKSWMERFEGEWREKIDWLRFHRQEDYTKALELCVELIAHGKEIQDPALIGFAHCYAGEIYFFQMKFPLAIHEGKTALAYLKNADAPFMLGHCYDLLGCLYMNNYSYELAIEYFLEGEKICEQNHDITTGTVMLLNIGGIYSLLDDHLNAQKFYRQVIHVMEDIYQESDYNYHIYTLANILMTSELISNDLVEEAESYIRITEVLMENHPIRRMDLCDYILLQYEYALKRKDKADEDKYFQLFYDAYENSESKAANLISFSRMVVDLYRKHQLENVKPMMPLIDSVLQEEISYSQKISLLRIKWDDAEDKTSPEAIGYLHEMIDTIEAYNEQDKQTKLAAIEELFSRDEEARKIDQWVEYANKDALTSLWNRRYFEQIFHQKMREAVRTNGPIAVGIMDVDFFKEFNDNYGHLAGDEALKRVTHLFFNYSDRNLLFARYGGDEFVFIASNLRKETLQMRIEALQSELRFMHVRHEYSKVSDCLTVSVGITYHSHVEKEILIESLIDEADKVLYDVKQTRRSTYALKEIEK